MVAGAAALLIRPSRPGHGHGAARGPRRRRNREPESIVERIADFVRDKPVTTIAAAIAAGLMAVRNPKYLGGQAFRAFVEGREWPNKRSTKKGGPGMSEAGPVIRVHRHSCVEIRRGDGQAGYCQPRQCGGVAASAE